MKSRAEAQLKVTQLLSRFGHNAPDTGDLSQRGMTRIEFDTIVTTLPRLKNTHLNFAGSGVGDDAILMLAEALKTNNVVKSLNLTETGITDIGAEGLKEMLAKNNTIVQIDLSNNIIRPSLRKQISRFLQSNIDFQEALAASAEVSEKKSLRK